MFASSKFLFACTVHRGIQSFSCVMVLSRISPLSLLRLLAREVTTRCKTCLETSLPVAPRLLLAVSTPTLARTRTLLFVSLSLSFYLYLSRTRASRDRLKERAGSRANICVYARARRPFSCLFISGKEIFLKTARPTSPPGSLPCLTKF